MSEHAPQIDHNQPPLPNQPFNAWLRHQTALYISQLLSLLGFISFFASLIYYLRHQDTEYFTPEKIQFSIYIAHLIILAIFIGWLIGLFDNDNEDLEKIEFTYHRIFNEPAVQVKDVEAKSRKQLKKFKIYFFWFWIAMYCLYISFTFSAYFESPTATAENNTQASHSTESSNKEHKADSAQEVKIYIQIDGVNVTKVDSNRTNEDKPDSAHSETPKTPAVTEEPKPENKAASSETRTNSKSIYGYIFPFLTFALNNIGSIFIYCCFTALFIPATNPNAEIRQKRHIFFWNGMILLFTLSFWIILFIRGYEKTDFYEYITVYDALSGVINAVVLALLIGRLDSKLIGLRSYLISVLYIYSAVQPLFVVFDQPEAVSKAIKIFVLIFVFIFKIYFFLIITYALQTGRMLNYLFCFPALNERVDSVFANQFEIIISERDGEFYLSIYRKNKPVYFGVEPFHNREKCKVRAKELRNLMKDESLVKILPFSEGFEIEVFDKSENRSKICYSIAHKSKADAEKLKFESIEKIPYCNIT
jgi:hypothetical protein